MPTALAVALGGAAGSLARYALVAALKRGDLAGPWGTLAVNVLGSFAIGAVWAWSLARPETPEWLRLGLMAGVLGGFTTLSAVSLETLQLLHGGAPAAAFANAAANVVLGLAACCAGFWALRPFFPA